MVRITNAGIRRPIVSSRRIMTREDFGRSEEHTTELQSQSNLVCRLLLEKKMRARRQKPWQDNLLELIERLAVAKEERLVGHQCVGEVVQKLRVATLPQRGGQRIQSGKLV